MKEGEGDRGVGVKEGEGKKGGRSSCRRRIRSEQGGGTGGGADVVNHTFRETCFSPVSKKSTPTLQTPSNLPAFGRYYGTP